MNTMKRKGFTLIELLGVIVVLAVIALITTPVILGVIEKSKKGALQSSGYGLVEAGILYHAEYQNSQTVRFDIKNNQIRTKEENKIDYKGSIKDGTILINNQGEVTVCINDGKYAAYKNYKDNKIIVVDQKTCTVPENNYIVYLDNESTIKEMTNAEITSAITKLTERVNQLEKDKATLEEENNTLKKTIEDVKVSINQKVDSASMIGLLNKKLDITSFNDSIIWKKTELTTPLVMPSKEWQTNSVTQKEIIGAKEILLVNQDGFQIHLINKGEDQTSWSYVSNGIADVYNWAINFYADFAKGKIYITTARIGINVINEQSKVMTFTKVYYR